MVWLGRGILKLRMVGILKLARWGRWVLKLGMVWLGGGDIWWEKEVN